MNIGINKFQNRVRFTVEYVNNNAKGRGSLEIGLCGFDNRQVYAKFFTS